MDSPFAVSHRRTAMFHGTNGVHFVPFVFSSFSWQKNRFIHLMLASVC